MTYKYYMTMSMYPEGTGEHLPMKLGKGTPFLCVNINQHRWEQTEIFNTEEEFQEWRENHPWGWNVICVNKIEEL